MPHPMTTVVAVVCLALEPAGGHIGPSSRTTYRTKRAVDVAHAVHVGAALAGTEVGELRSVQMPHADVGHEMAESVVYVVEHPMEDTREL